MSEQAFQIGTQIKLNDNWIMTGEEYEEGVYWPSTGDIGQVREIDEDQLWVEFPNLEGVWPVEFYMADIVKPMAEELAALETTVYTVQRRCGYDAHYHQPDGECPGDGLELTASTLPLPPKEPDEYDRLDNLKQRYYDQRLEAWERQRNFPDYKGWLENMVLRLEDARVEDAQAFNPYAALAFHILNAKVAVLPEETWNNNWTPGQTVNELASEIERLQAALDKERAGNVTLRAELQALKSAVRQG